MNNWTNFIKSEFEQPYFKDLSIFLKEEYENKVIYPPKDLIFSAFDYCDYDNVKVVILGQDPYHQPNQAHGMCFSVNKGVKIPSSLVNIYKELNNDLGCSIPSHGYLMQWAKQGVFLLNTILTVEANKASSHKNKGWETFTNHTIEKLNKHKNPLVFILWGNYAKSKASMIDDRHLIISSVHPSPLSAYNGFFNSKPFSKCNDFLIKNGIKPIDWQIYE
ncbi:MAG: uracil-DNA glycosylase [Erysipelotrichaceae bacterium]|nr:uracil-DNA glycosylase [Erysipelotrichaceae bacterium]